MPFQEKGAGQSTKGLPISPTKNMDPSYMENKFMKQIQLTRLQNAIHYSLKRWYWKLNLCPGIFFPTIDAVLSSPRQGRNRQHIQKQLHWKKRCHNRRTHLLGTDESCDTWPTVRLFQKPRLAY